jgi:hypothetical protein
MITYEAEKLYHEDREGDEGDKPQALRDLRVLRG